MLRGDNLKVVRAAIEYQYRRKEGKKDRRRIDRHI